MSSHTGVGPPACPVCGTAITEAPQLCARCDTPHHADCWGYTGRCAVYGCMGTTPAGGAPLPVTAPGNAVVIMPPAGIPLSLADSAARVQPIVPASRSNDGRELCWLADADGAWVGKRDAQITVAPGERVVMLPRQVRDRLLPPDERGQLRRRGWLSLLAMVAAGAVGGLLQFVSVSLAKLATGGLLSIAVALALSLKSRPAQRAWLAVNSKGTWLHGVSQDRPWEILLEPATRPRKVRLDRAYETGRSDASRTLLTYHLVLEWSPEPEWVDAESPDHALGLALQMPETAAERRPVLEQLVALRALGHHIAAALGVPFQEGVSAS